MHLLVAILENGRHLRFSIYQSDRIYLKTIEMSHANFGACITNFTIHPKNANYLLHCKSVTTGPKGNATTCPNVISITKCVIVEKYCVVSALGDPRRERPPAVYGHVINVPNHFNVKLPLSSGHLHIADADSHLLVVTTCYNEQCKQMPRFRWSFQPKIAGALPNNIATDSSLKFTCCRLVTTSNMSRHRE